MTYNETSTCPICGSCSNVTVRAYGDYDGPDKPRETHPANCPTCDGIKQANPTMWAMLERLWKKLEKERADHQKEQARRNRESFAEWELYQPFHPLLSELRFLKFHDQQIKQNKGFAKAGDDDPWVRKTSMRALIFEVAKTIANQKK